MDFNQHDRAALIAKLCPDCGKQVIIEETSLWCKACNVWFEFNFSGWVIRNKEADKYFSLLKMARDRVGKNSIEGGSTAYR